MKSIFRIFKYIMIIVVVLGVVLVAKTMRYAPEAISDAKPVTLAVDVEKAAANLGKAITFKTISFSVLQKPDPAPFNGFINWLAASYPNVSANMKRETYGAFSQVYIWQGSDPSLKPILLTAHYDVVPVPKKNLDLWEQEPFSGIISDGYVWGRGALDDKISVIAMMEAAEMLIGEGFKPKRSIYFAFGHDEELGGIRGAGAIVSHYKSKGVQFAWSLDEGSAILDGIIPGLPHPVASINVAEKGYMTLKLKAKATPGHSSLPPSDTAIGSLAKAITRLEENQVEGGLTGVSESFFDALGRHFGFVQRMLFANRWLFGSILEGELSKANTTNAMLRTTTAPTVINAGIKDNVLPATAEAKINFRIHPRDTPESVIAHVEAIIDDENVTVKPQGKPKGASKVSSSEADGYQLLADTFRAVFGKIITIPGLTIAATDSVHYSKISDNSYRILPIKLTSDNLKGIHGPNERISLKEFENAIVFYHELMKRGGG